ncbi:PREDICTED: uncharacterized protein LOC107328299 [Acropora digitifera]|uniref:uncharacterized protein LOC107328299 n=1 Tax=Acropora digitifera TaxID=70779 RepID=UPI00077B04A0|nr:PREDICTED: uncharacterized protein LOC107328299 [Acropora digitifera]
MSRGRQANHRKFPSSAMVCQDCPEFMYSFETMREDWTQACSKYGREYHLRLRYYFNNTFERHLKEIMFVIAYGIDHTAGIFVDFKGYEFFKDKVKRAVHVKNSRQLPDISPTKVSRKTPRVMRIFHSVKDFIRFTNQLRHKNNAIVRQRYVNGVHLLERINAVLEKRQPCFLVLDAKMCELDPKKVTQIGWVVFSLENPKSCQRYYFENNKNVLQGKNDILRELDTDHKFQFKSIEMPNLNEALTNLQSDISGVDFVVTYSMSIESVKTFLRSQGLQFELNGTIDIITLYSALFHESRKENSMEEVMKKLDIPYESFGLENARYSVVYIMQTFRALLSQEFCIRLNL